MLIKSARVLTLTNTFSLAYAKIQQIKLGENSNKSFKIYSSVLHGYSASHKIYYIMRSELTKWLRENQNEESLLH